MGIYFILTEKLSEHVCVRACVHVWHTCVFVGVCCVYVCVCVYMCLHMCACLCTCLCMCLCVVYNHSIFVLGFIHAVVFSCMV